MKSGGNILRHSAERERFQNPLGFVPALRKGINELVFKLNDVDFAIR